MGYKVILLALSFMVIFEGLMPLIAPKKWKMLLESIAPIPEERIRATAALAVVIGLLCVWLLF